MCSKAASNNFRLSPIYPNTIGPHTNSVENKHDKNKKPDTHCIPV